MTMRTVYRGDALQQSLIMLHKSIADVMMSVVVNNVAGMVVANHIGEHSTIDEPDAIAAASAILLDMAENSLSRLDKGETLKRIIMQWNEGTLVVYHCTGDISLAVLIAKDAKLGIALVAVEQAALKISGIMMP